MYENTGVVGYLSIPGMLWHISLRCVQSSFYKFIIGPSCYYLSSIKRAGTYLLIDPFESYLCCTFMWTWLGEPTSHVQCACILIQCHSFDSCILFPAWKSQVAEFNACTSISQTFDLGSARIIRPAILPSRTSRFAHAPSVSVYRRRRTREFWCYVHMSYVISVRGSSPYARVHYSNLP